LAEFGAAPELAQVDRDFAHLFASWFNRGFLVLQRIDWSTPAAILEKIIRYEAVHAISDWADLRRRIDPPDRRCFAFFHPSLADDPLIFVEVALTGEAPEAIGPILAEDRKALDPRGATTAVFYSISNCQRGLAGISFGSFLIKQVAEELAREFPGIKTFVTLSPMPLFRGWLRRLEGEALDVRDRRALQFLEHETWANKASASRRLKAVLEPLAAHYLMRVKRGDGRPFDPVARFHLGNGAQLEKLNWMADKSAKGMAESAGLMVNYRYVLSRIEQNHEAYANTGEVIASASVRGLLRAEPREVAEIAAP